MRFQISKRGIKNLTNFEFSGIYILGFLLWLIVGFLLYDLVYGKNGIYEYIRISELVKLEEKVGILSESDREGIMYELQKDSSGALDYNSILDESNDVIDYWGI